MPCRSEYMEPTALEHEYARLELLQEELDTGNPVDPTRYHAAARYGATKHVVDAATEILCKRLRKMSAHEIREMHSLELQMWWRDHQAFDKKRKQTYTLHFVVEYTAEVESEYPPGTDGFENDAFSSFDIPDNNQVKYQVESFQPIKAVDHEGNETDLKN